MESSNSAPPAVLITRVIDAPQDDVFDSWLDADGMRDWMTPFGTAEMTMDPRVGGEFRLVMSGQGLEIEHIGVYRIIDPPRLLQFTWRSHFTGMRDTLVTIALEGAEGNRTTLTLRHEGLIGDEIESHGGGWGTILDRLATKLTAEARSGR